MRLGIFAKTFARSSPEGVFDALASHDLRETQFNMSVAGLPSMPDEIDPALADRVRRPPPSSTSRWPPSQAPSTWPTRTRRSAGTVCVVSA